MAPKYTTTEKMEIVSEVLQAGQTKAAVGRKYKVPESTLRGWCKQEEIRRAEEFKKFIEQSPNSSGFSMKRKRTDDEPEDVGCSELGVYYPYEWLCTTITVIDEFSTSLNCQSLTQSDGCVADTGFQDKPLDLSIPDRKSQKDGINNLLNSREFKLKNI